MNILSDSESSDSDTGRRFKTASTRNRDDLSSFKNGNNSSNRRDEREIKRTERRSFSRSLSKEQRSSSRRRNSRDRDRDRDRRHDSSDRKSNSSRQSDRRRVDRDRERERDRGREREEPRRDRSADRNRDRDRDRDKNREREDKDRERYRNRDTSSQLERRKREEKSSSRRASPVSEEVDRSQRQQSKQRDKQLDKQNEKTPEIEAKKVKKSRHKKHKHKSRHEEKEKEPDTRSPKKKEEKRSSVSEENVDEAKSTPEIDRVPSPLALNDEPLGCCGPVLPPHMVAPKQSESASSSGESYGPRLPPKHSEPESISREEPRVLGPMLPSGIDLEAIATTSHHDTSAIEPMSSDSSDGEVVGPLPEGAEKSSAQLELEKRALELKLAQLGGDDQSTKDEPTREEWMTALPNVRSVTGLGLAARQFRTKPNEIGDRSGWTETPKDRERKVREHAPSAEELTAAKQRESEALYRAKRDAEQAELVKKHKKKHKRDESLLDMHQKKLKKKKDKEREKEKDTEKVERRPFSRDVDLKVNRFDEAQKKSILKKAQLLDTRFSSGQSKFL